MIYKTFHTGGGTNSERHHFVLSNFKFKILPTPTEIVLIPNQKICSADGISDWFGISNADINTRVIRAPPL